MSLRRTACTVALVGAASIAMLVAFLGESASDARDRGEALDCLQQIERLEVEMSHSVLELSQDRVFDFDSLADLQRKGLSARTRLREHSIALFECREPTALADLERLTDHTEVRWDAIERFKSDLAILRNSTRYFPVAVVKAQSEVADLGNPPELVDALLCVAMVTVDRSAAEPGADGRRLERALKVLRAAQPEMPNSAIAALLRHVQSMQRYKRAIKEHLDLVTHMAVLRQGIQSIQDHVATVAEADEARSQLQRTSLFVLGVICLCSAWLAWSRLQSSRDAVQRMNDNLEVHIQERTAELERESRAKSEFLANMSHEIRTPMAAIIGYSDVLEEEVENEEKRAECIESIRRNGHFLLAVISDVLDLSKIEAGKMSIERIDWSPAEPVRTTAAMMRSRATEQGLSFEVEWPEELPATIQTDPTRLTQVLVNLVGNAIKFTARGRVTIAVSFERERPELLAIEVRDTGVGIAEDRIGCLFDAFTQADSSTTRRFGGTGLGLAISAQLAGLLGGRISVTSEEGAGSTFRLEIETGIRDLDGVEMIAVDEAAKAGACLAQTDAPAVQGGLVGRVLLVEDGIDNQRLISRMLSKRGLSVSLAENGREACDFLLAEDAERVDLVLMDMQMPVMDGYTATATLRSAGFEGPIIAVTAHALEGELQRCLDAGCSEYVTKPVSRRHIDRLLNRHLGAADA